MAAVAAAALPPPPPPAAVGQRVWDSLPRHILALCFAHLAAAANEEGGERGVTLHKAAALLAGLSPSCEWRAVALDSVCLRVRLDWAGQLRSPLLTRLRCTELWLPSLPSGLAHEEQRLAVQAMCRLLSSPAFRQRSGGCLAALHRMPLSVAGSSGALSGACSGAAAAFPSLRHLSLADSALPMTPIGYLEAQALRRNSLPSGLHTLELPARLLAAGVGECLPAGLRRLVLLSSQDLAVGCTSLAPTCAEVAARTSRTATLLPEAIGAAQACRRLEVSARWVVLSSPDPAHYLTLQGAAAVPRHAAAAAATQLAAAHPMGAAPSQPEWGLGLGITEADVALPLSLAPVGEALSRWLAVLASILSHSSISNIQITALELSLYDRATGKMALLPLGRWRQPGEVQVAAAAHGLEARLSWPAASQPPAYGTLTVWRRQRGKAE